MNIITTSPSAKRIQTWSCQSPPEGYALLPNTVGTTEFYTYNGFVTLTLEGDTVTAMTPNIEAWEAWQASLPEPEPEPEPELDTWDEIASAIEEGVNSI